MLTAAALVTAEAPATRPATAPADRAPAAFKLFPATGDTKTANVWKRLDAKTWEEFDGKRRHRYELVEFDRNPKDPGVILTRLPRRDMQVFLPTLDNPDVRAGWRYPPGKEPPDAPPKGEGFDWYTLGRVEFEN